MAKGKNIAYVRVSTTEQTRQDRMKLLINTILTSGILKKSQVKILIDLNLLRC